MISILAIINAGYLEGCERNVVLISLEFGSFNETLSISGHQAQNYNNFLFFTIPRKYLATFADVEQVVQLQLWQHHDKDNDEHNQDDNNNNDKGNSD